MSIVPKTVLCTGAALLALTLCGTPTATHAQTARSLSPRAIGLLRPLLPATQTCLADMQDLAQTAATVGQNLGQGQMDSGMLGTDSATAVTDCGRAYRLVARIHPAGALAHDRTLGSVLGHLRAGFADIVAGAHQTALIADEIDAGSVDQIAQRATLAGNDWNAATAHLQVATRYLR
jgi:hypothetical protein